MRSPRVTNYREPASAFDFERGIQRYPEAGSAPELDGSRLVLSCRQGRTMQHPVIDAPEVVRTKGGTLRTRRGARLSVSERQWTADLLAAFPQWGDLLELPSCIRVDLEYRIAPPEFLTQPMSLGLPRVDAILWHSNTQCSILEAKVTSSPSDIMCGIGQLLYYRTLLKAWRGVEVKATILAAPYLPPFVLETIAQARIPIRYLKAGRDGFSGLVPDAELTEAQRVDRSGAEAIPT